MFLKLKIGKKYSMMCFVLNCLGQWFSKFNNCRKITENDDIHVFSNIDFVENLVYF